MQVERALRDGGLERGDLDRLQRRLFLRHGLSLSSLALLTGCDVLVSPPVDGTLRAISSFNDGVAAALFGEGRLAPTYGEADVVQDFRYNGFYPAEQAPVIDPAGWRLEVAGRVDDKRPWTLDRLRGLPQEAQITRHVCVEGWSMIGKWGGVPLRAFLTRVGADLDARYVTFRCEDRIDYWSSMDMASAVHPQTILCLDFADWPLSPKYGAPMRIKAPTKLGFKQPKHVVSIEVTNDYPGGFWENNGYNWFSGI